MNSEIDFKQMVGYFNQKLSAYGATPGGVDWNSTASQETRFNQLIKICEATGMPSQEFTINDYGCGYGALITYLTGKDYRFQYTGYDLSESMVMKAQELFKDRPEAVFTTRQADLPIADYTVASGIFNLRFDIQDDIWLAYILKVLHQMNDLSMKGFSFNLLTKYSDADHIRPDLYYADPCYLFDYCKKHFSRNVALLHDYDLYDFTLLVRKQVGSIQS